ncbi:DUF1540 domain-containing protein [Saccharibacillus endophyticus]|uniref:DUF1540 domain-containing protein n=1 Tax=Saccharibacillus endophyticus TaxID=2060666 RepID=A0ABQ1ZSF6_9BACL|nr:hypothetical protein GCM10007362_15120 [Saccharibacillus endophyticus]
MSTVQCQVSDCTNWEANLCTAEKIEVVFAPDHTAECTTFEEKQEA